MPTLNSVVKEQNDDAGCYDDGDAGHPVPLQYGYRYRINHPGSPVYCYAEPVESSDGLTFGQVYLVDRNGNVNPDISAPVYYYGRHLSDPRPIPNKGA